PGRLRVWRDVVDLHRAVERVHRLRRVLCHSFLRERTRAARRARIVGLRGYEKKRRIATAAPSSQTPDMVLACRFDPPATTTSAPRPVEAEQRPEVHQGVEDVDEALCPSLFLLLPEGADRALRE